MKLEKTSRKLYREFKTVSTRKEKLHSTRKNNLSFPQRTTSEKFSSVLALICSRVLRRNSERKSDKSWVKFQESFEHEHRDSLESSVG